MQVEENKISTVSFIHFRHTFWCHKLLKNQWVVIEDLFPPHWHSWCPEGGRLFHHLSLSSISSEFYSSLLFMSNYLQNRLSASAWLLVKVLLGESKAKAGVSILLQHLAQCTTGLQRAAWVAVEDLTLYKEITLKMQTSVHPSGKYWQILISCTCSAGFCREFLPESVCFHKLKRKRCFFWCCNENAHLYACSLPRHKPPHTLHIRNLHTRQSYRKCHLDQNKQHFTSAAPPERIRRLIKASASSDSNISSPASKARADISSCLLLVLLTLEAQWMIPETAMWGNQSLADLQSHSEVLFFTSEYHSDLCQICGSAHIVL